jgi:hypothetical protein
MNRPDPSDFRNPVVWAMFYDDDDDEPHGGPPSPGPGLGGCLGAAIVVCAILVILGILAVIARH